MGSAALSATGERTAYRPNRRWDRVFFSGMALLILAAVLWGFARTYFLAGMVAAPLPNRLIHVHGAVFSLWIVLLIVQTALVSAKKIQVHRALGLWGFGLAVVMCILGPIAAVDMMRRGSAPGGLNPLSFFIVPITAIGLFAVIIFFAYKTRRTQPDGHKRLVIIATIAIIDAAIGRWPVALLQSKPPLQDLVMLGFLLLVVFYDLFSLRRVHRATLWASALVIVVHLVRMPIGFSAPWIAFAGKIAAGGKH